MNAVDFLDAHRIVLTALVLWLAFNGLAVRWLARLKGVVAQPQTLACIDGMSATLTQPPT